MLSETQKVYLEGMARDFGYEEVEVLCTECYKKLKTSMNGDSVELKKLKDLCKGSVDYSVHSKYEFAKESLSQKKENLKHFKRTSVRVIEGIFGSVPVCELGACMGFKRVAYIEIDDECVYKAAKER